jgi:hypothetical protein
MKSLNDVLDSVVSEINEAYRRGADLCTLSEAIRYGAPDTGVYLVPANSALFGKLYRPVDYPLISGCKLKGYTKCN